MVSKPYYIDDERIAKRKGHRIKFNEIKEFIDMNH